MAGLTSDSKSNIAFKRLIGKAHTSNQTPFYSENIASQIWIGFDEVLGEPIPEDPQAGVNAGVAEFVECELTVIGASNGLAYNIEFPTGYSGYFNASSGDRIRDYTQVVSKKNNLRDGPAKANHSGGYVYSLYDDGSPVPLNAAENWQVDPVAGLVVSESPLNLTNGTIKLYLYTGKFLNETVSGGINVQEDEIAFGSASDGVEGSQDLTYDGTELRVAKDLLVEGSFGFDQGVDVNSISSDIGLGGNSTSHDKLATQKAIKTYVDLRTGTTDNIPEGSTNLYYTDERVDDRVSSLLQTGEDIDMIYDDPMDTLTLELATNIDMGTISGGGGSTNSVNSGPTWDSGGGVESV